MDKDGGKIRSEFYGVQLDIAKYFIPTSKAYTSNRAACKELAIHLLGVVPSGKHLGNYICWADIQGKARQFLSWLTKKGLRSQVKTNGK